ncbi:MAG: putative sugar O-methyltransferase [archaeon]|nr:putative sugar O-methyltransferase [archaeon]
MLKKTLYSFYEKLRDLRTEKSRNYLRRYKRYQEKNFAKNIHLFKRFEKNLETEKLDKFIQPLWKKDYQRMKETFLDSGFSFLRNPVIRETMFTTKEGKLMRNEIRFLEEKISEGKLKYLLEEENIGNPILSNNKYRTSHNTIHQLYHLIFYSEASKVNFGKVKRVVEWGGGYGNLARIFKKFNPFQTYTIIDLPTFSCIQWVYLSSVFGEKKINFIASIKDKIEEGKINILPICFLEKIKLHADLFISTWALNESSEYSQNYVIKNKWFGSKNQLLAIQNKIDENFNASPIIDYAKKNSLKIIPIKNLHGSSYLFK